MPRYRVDQMVECTVHVWYEIEADNDTAAVEQVAANDVPTCVDGRDFEINSDDRIVSTTVRNMGE